MRLPGLNRIYLTGSSASQFPLEQSAPQGFWVPCFSLSTRANCFISLNDTSPQVHCYADDTQLNVSFSPNRSADADFVIKSMTDCISDIRSWMISDNLMLNGGKTEFYGKG